VRRCTLACRNSCPARTAYDLEFRISWPQECPGPRHIPDSAIGSDIYSRILYISRSLWLTIILLSLLAFLYTAYDCVQLYMKQTSSTTTTGSDPRLPSITVCNINQLRFLFTLFHFFLHICPCKNLVTNHQSLKN